MQRQGQWQGQGQAQVQGEGQGQGQGQELGQGQGQGQDLVQHTGQELRPAWSEQQAQRQAQRAQQVWHQPDPNGMANQAPERQQNQHVSHNIHDTSRDHEAQSAGQPVGGGNHLNAPQTQPHGQEHLWHSVHEPSQNHMLAQVSSTPIMAPKPGRPDSETQQQLLPVSAQLSQSADQAPPATKFLEGPHTAVVSQIPSLAPPPLPSHQPNQSPAVPGHQHSFSTVPDNSTDEGQLSARQRALRSLSSKGIQLSRTASSKNSGELPNLPAPSFPSQGKLSRGPWREHSPNPSTNAETNGDVAKEGTLGSDGVNQSPSTHLQSELLSHKIGSVRALASRLELGSSSTSRVS